MSSFDGHLNDKAPPLRRHSKTPSFSSVLLDSVYRSFDAHDSGSTAGMAVSTNHHHHSNQTQNSKSMIDKEQSVNLKRAIMIEHWIEEQQDQNLRNHPKPNRRAASYPNFSGTDFSSCFTPHIPHKIRTTFTASKTRDANSPPNIRPFITRTKSRALKIYGDLKKARGQPGLVSPGAKIVSFLNSLFMANRIKRGNSVDGHQGVSSSIDRNAKMASTSSSACSSASSFSRSYLAKSTPSSSRSNGNGQRSSLAKRSVKFYPLSVIVGEDSRPCGHKRLYERREQKPIRPIDSAKLTRMPNMGRSNPWFLQDDREIGNKENEMLGEEREDAESYASSDLFELENLEEAGVLRYVGYEEDLPVYGTTSLEKNMAIANGFRVV